MTNKIFDVQTFKGMSSSDLVAYADEIGIESIGSMKRHEIIVAILTKLASDSEIYGAGVLEVLQGGFGFLRSSEDGYVANAGDVYVSPSQIKKFSLKTGDRISGQLKIPKDGEKYFTLAKALLINDCELSSTRRRVAFEDLTPTYPTEMIMLESEHNEQDLTCRFIDLFTPIGKGQRSLIVAPPRVGKTVMLESIAKAITTNYPDIHLIVLLVGERPEEVTEMINSVKAEIVSSTFDEPPSRHVQVAEIAIERAKRLVEYKKDVVILLDSITRLARAYNAVCPLSGKILTGGLDANALQKPKQFFGAARNVKEGGSLTILATALTDTGSKMDDVIFEEFKGTGNSEMILNRKVADKRIFPAIDVARSGTRREELLLDADILSKVWVLRRIVQPMGDDATQFLVEKMSASKNNKQFLYNMGRT